MMEVTADIYIKPAKVVPYIKLNFIVVPMKRFLPEIEPWMLWDITPLPIRNPYKLTPGQSKLIHEGAFRIVRLDGRVAWIGKHDDFICFEGEEPE